MLERQLDKDDLTWDQKKYLIEKIMETGKWELEKDSENKRFLDSMFGKVVLAGAAAVALGVAFVGGKVVTQREGSDES
jgi:hypothetical protein